MTSPQGLGASFACLCASERPLRERADGVANQACHSARGQFTAAGMGRQRIGDDPLSLLKRGGQPSQRTGRMGARACGSATELRRAGCTGAPRGSAAACTYAGPRGIALRGRRARTARADLERPVAVHRNGDGWVAHDVVAPADALEVPVLRFKRFDDFFAGNRREAVAHAVTAARPRSTGRIGSPSSAITSK